MMDSQLSQDFQIQDLYSMFQVPQQEEEPMDSDRSMESLIHSENNFFPIYNRLEGQMSHLINVVKDRNEETPTTCSTIPDCPSHIDENQESWYLETLTKIQFHHKTLNLTIVNPMTNWQVFISMKLNLNVNVTPIPNLVIQFSSSNLG